MTDVLHILVVDDDSDDAELVRRGLVSDDVDVQVHHVPSAINAYAWLGKHPPFVDAPTPDLILLDLSMPVMPGSQMLRVLKSDSRWSLIPVVVVSGSDSEIDRRTCAALGAADYLVKPVTVPEILKFNRLLAEQVSRMREARQSPGWSKPGWNSAEFSKD